MLLWYHWQPEITWVRPHLPLAEIFVKFFSSILLKIKEKVRWGLHWEKNFQGWLKVWKSNFRPGIKNTIKKNFLKVSPTYIRQLPMALKWVTHTLDRSHSQLFSWFSLSKNCCSTLWIIQQPKQINFEVWNNTSNGPMTPHLFSTFSSIISVEGFTSYLVKFYRLIRYKRIFHVFL